jgi:DNA repair protein RadA/Sms
MSKIDSRYVCQQCGYESPRWVGRCPNCSQWNTFVEEVSQKKTSHRKITGSQSRTIRLTEVDVVKDQRLRSSIEEFDRVLGGGVVPGSVILLGGDPGVGKSTLMVQIAAGLRDQVVLYISGEESPHQLKLRAERLRIQNLDSLFILSETNVDVIAEIIARDPPDVVIVDSIQTMFRPQFDSSPGSVAQVRESTAVFARIAKEKSIPMFLIGHVTKEGVIAGPKVIEHIVDTVLQFEGERHYAYRILRSMKNRFGSTNEIGVFEMCDTGLQEVKNPSELFLSQRTFGASGSAVVASVEGTRPILIEVQALVTPSSFNVPQRNTTGFDYRRLSLLIAVLEKRMGILLGQYDVFVNIAGGVRVDEPAVDLGIAASIISSIRDNPIDSQTVAVGEIGLGGEIRNVSNIDKRIQEASKLGFERIVLPRNNIKGQTQMEGIQLVGVDRIDEAVASLLR